jgi:NAD(P)H-dependent flavin oxidoreductase YrpB (nitropropane dioxygenase family)
MLTHHDVTVPNALEVFNEVKDTGIFCVGFKDIGLPVKELATLVGLMRKEGKTILMEVVSETKEYTIQSVKNAVKLGVDYLIGGTYIEPALWLLKGSGIKYFPYIGKVIGHPCLLRGTIDEIVRDAKRVEALGADGINLLAYRFDGDVNRLMISVRDAVNIPIIVAGSINNFERIRKVVELGMWGFTIGGAIFENKFVPKGDLRDQIIAVINEIKNAKKRK